MLFSPTFMVFIMTADIKQGRDLLPSMCGDNSGIPASGLLLLAVYRSNERCYVHAWFSKI